MDQMFVSGHSQKAVMPSFDSLAMKPRPLGMLSSISQIVMVLGSLGQSPLSNEPDTTPL